MRMGIAIADPATTIDDARTIESLGFDVVAVGEHLVHNRAAPNPYVQLAAAAAVTTRVRLLSSVSLLPLYPAALAAKLATTLDQVAAGRLDLGLGAGGEHPPEFAAAGVDVRSRFRRLEEGLEVLKVLFSGRPGAFDGEFTRFTDVHLDPPPVQPNGPPIWLPGRRGGALRRAGRWADVWMPYMMTPRMFAEGLQQVRQAAADHGRPTHAVKGALFAFTCVDADEDWARRTGVAEVSAGYRQDFAPLADRYLLLGRPERVVERLLEFREAGVEHAILGLAAPPEARTRVLHTLAEQVLPAVRSG